MTVSSSNKHPRIFVGFPYSEPYLSLYGTRVASAIRECGWDPTMPLGAVPQGILLDRIAELISGSERTVFEVGTWNGNVCFELGVGVATRHPIAVMTDRDPAELPGILRSPWLHHYDSGDACVAALTGFLGLENLIPIAPLPPVPGDPELVVVVGRGERTRTLQDALEASGHSIVCRPPSTIRSLAEATQLAESCGALVVVRPLAGKWDGDDATAALATLGVAYGSHRLVIIGAGHGEQVPSDCTPLVVRGADDTDLAASVIQLIDQPVQRLPPSGTVRPGIEAALPRTLCSPVADELRLRGRALLLAEPGYGKTTVLHQVADRLCYPTAWVTIEPNWSVADLVERIVAAVGQHIPQFGWHAWATVQRSQQAAEQSDNRLAPPPAPHPTQLAELLVARDGPSAATPPVLLVIDDIHHSTGDGAQLLAHLAQHVASQLRLILAGRDAPPEMRSAAAEGRLACWTAEELQFSGSETSTYLRQSIPDLDDERATLIHECSEGWPAALAVIRAWLAANKDATVETLVAMTRGDRHRIYQLFAAGYFSQLPKHTQNDLFAFSLPPRLDASVAQKLLGPSGGVRLRDLIQGPYFLTEAETGVFHLHSLFREFLSQRWIDQRGQASLQAAKSALARWYQDQDDPVSAYQVACEGNDWTTAIDAIRPFVRLFAAQGDFGFLKELLGPMPPAQIRNSRPFRESWVRALVATGSTEALVEARALASAEAPSAADQALADLLLAETEHNLGNIDDAALARICDGIAKQLIAQDSLLSLSARLLSLDSRMVRSINPEAWPQLLVEARDLISAAEAANALELTAGATSSAADLAARIAETEFRSETLQLKITESYGIVLPLETRVECARYFIAKFREVFDLYEKAFDLAEAAKSPLAIARVQIAFARFLVLHTGLAFLRSGDGDDSIGAQAETALQLALSAAKTYSDFGIPRSVVIALNAAAEAASVRDDRTRVEELTQEASRVANQYGYTDLGDTATRIAGGPTLRDRYRRSRTRPRFGRQSTTQLNEFVEQLIRMSGVTPSDAQRARPLLRLEVADLATLEVKHEEVCQYLTLLRNLSGPRIGPFFAELCWSLTCRMRGISSVSRSGRADPLLRRFIQEICSSCEFRSPGQADSDMHSDEQIYAPLLERLASEMQQSTDH